MELSSPLFFVFLLIFLALYYLFPKNLRTLPIIFASCFFLLSYDIGLLVFLALFILINYFFLLPLSYLRRAIFRRLTLFLSVFFNVCILASFKYIPFIQKNFSWLSSLVHLNLSYKAFTLPMLPIGISFLVFKMISLLIDSYKDKPHGLNLINFSAYLIFFPEFLSGPIDRFSNFSQSLKNQTIFLSNNFLNGAYRFLLGLFKKLIIANNLALLINPIYDHPSLFKSSSLLISTYLFSLQIFFDFSGYSDMAIGIGKMLGFSIPENFNQPYFANSIKEFWRRWHITLSSWFRDYLYIPLGGNRKGLTRQIINILIVFFVTGFWHGASWNFVFWGLIHGFYQILSLFIEKLNLKIKNFINIFFTFNLVNFAWIFFRAKSLKQAISFIGYIFKFRPSSTSLNLIVICVPFILTLILYLLLYLSQTQRHPIIIKTTVSAFIILSLLFFSPSQPQDFLYFKF